MSDDLTDTESKKLDEKYQAELQKFENFFMDGYDYEKHIFKWLGWKREGKHVRFQCPKCGHNKGYYLEKNERGEKRKVYQCQKNSKHQPSVLVPTIMKSTRTPLRFWFFCIYVIGLLRGKVPWQFLLMRGKDFNDGTGKNRIIMPREIEKVTKGITAALEDNPERARYLRLVGMGRMDDFLEWYDSNRISDWKVGWKKNKFSKKETYIKEIIDKYGNELDYAFEMDKRSVSVGDWLLCCLIKKNNTVGKIRWIYVSAVERIPYSSDCNGYRYVAIQFKKKENFYRCPFRLTEEFDVAVRQTRSTSVLKKMKRNGFSKLTVKPLKNIKKKMNENLRHRD